jgi:hypothetical protein
MAGPISSSPKSIGERLQVKRDRRLALVRAPVEIEALIGLADRRGGAEQADVVVLFAANRDDIAQHLRPLLTAIRPDAIFWIAYPKLTSSLAGDLQRDVLRELAPSYGLDTVSQIAIDATWSALRFKRTLPQR